MKNKICNTDMFDKVNRLILFLFIFNVVNREFKISIFDVRIIVLCLVGLGSIYALINNYKVRVKSIQKLVILFYITFFISTIFRGINLNYIDKSNLVRVSILYIYNALIIIYLISFKSFNQKELMKYLLFSVLILILSFPLSYYSRTGNLVFSTIDGIFIGNHMKNFYGLPFRLAGYAQDPNYASLTFFMTGVLVLYSKMSKINKVSLISILFIAFGFSASKTILLGGSLSFFLVYSISFVSNLINKNNGKKIIVRRSLYLILTIAVFSAPIILMMTGIYKHILFDYSTIYQRYDMWLKSLEIFYQSPLFGNGIASARSYYGTFSRIVQIHSTPIQILSEGGLFASIIYVMFMIKMNSSKNKLVSIISVSFLIFGLSYETAYLQYLPFIVIVYYTFEAVSVEKEKYDVVTVNSLSGGGAEVIARNLILEMSKTSEVILFTTDPKIDDEKYINENIQHIKLSKYNIFSNVFKINSIVDDVGLDNLKSSSCHLFKAHVNIRLSLLSQNSLFYFHGTVDSSDQSKLMVLLNRFVYKNRKLVFLNEEIKNEFINDFRLNSNKLYISKNFIDFNRIEAKSKETSPKVQSPYILFVGRLEKIKDPLLALEIYASVKDFIPHDLYFIGEGSLRGRLETKVNELNLKKNVHLVGFQDNPYPWIKNADLVMVTSEAESDSLVIVESLFLKTKVISRDCNYGPRLILTHELSEFLIESGNPKDYSVTVIKALENYPASYDYVFEGRDIQDYIDKLRNIYLGKD